MGQEIEHYCDLESEIAELQKHLTRYVKKLYPEWLFSNNAEYDALRMSINTQATMIMAKSVLCLSRAIENANKNKHGGES